MDDNSLLACSVCLRVLRGSEWIEPEQMIRELRSFALHDPPKLGSALCTHCAESIQLRRGQTRRPIAA
jgi:hypothetical protein